MSRKVLISLVSDQTIPNVQLIKEFYNQIDRFLFISTTGMEEAGNRNWIIQSSNIPEEKLLEPIIVNHHSFEDIEEKLKAYGLSDDDEYIVNITGGTKVMSISVFEFFKDLKSEIFYLTGFNNEYIKVFPGKRKQSLTLTEFISLEVYLFSYGFEIRNKGELLKSEDFTNNFFDYFNNDITQSELETLDSLRSFRNKNLKISDLEGLSGFISKTNFQPKNQEKLSKYESRYLSGDWFEEYVFNKVKSGLELEENKIGIGYNLIKKGVENEFDVLFVYQNSIYTIECKTSIFNNVDGREKSIIGEVLYKSDSLQKEFGLHTRTSIFTLSSIKNSDGTVNPKLESHYKRAKLNRISIITKSDLVSGQSIKQILNLK